MPKIRGWNKNRNKLRWWNENRGYSEIEIEKEPLTKHSSRYYVYKNNVSVNKHGFSTKQAALKYVYNYMKRHPNG